MALGRRSLIKQVLRNVLAAAKPTIPTGLPASPSELQRSAPARSFSSLLTKWQDSRVNNFHHSQIYEAFSAHHLHHHPHQRLDAFPVQQVRYVYVEVIDNDLDAAIKVYKRKMNNAKIEDKLKEKRFYSKPSERRKLAKHYKKLNRARRELSGKIRTVKHRMEKIAEVRKIEKEERKAKAAAAAADKAKSSQSSG